jgi:hypothetical protein
MGIQYDSNEGNIQESERRRQLRTWKLSSLSATRAVADDTYPLIIPTPYVHIESPRASRLRAIKRHLEEQLKEFKLARETLKRQSYVRHAQRSRFMQRVGSIALLGVAFSIGVSVSGKSSKGDGNSSASSRWLFPSCSAYQENCASVLVKLVLL